MEAISYSIDLIIRIAAAAVIAVIFGNGSVVVFNRIRQDWFLDYEDADTAGRGGRASGADADGNRSDTDDAAGGAAKDALLRKVLPPALAEADREGRQRLPSSPWKYAFTGCFGITGLYLAIRGGSLMYEIAVLCVLFIVLEMAIADQLYQTVPDQFCIMLAVSAAAFLGYHEKWWEPAAGALLGLGISLVILLLGQLLFRTGSIGGADIKFFTCIGLVTGRTGVAVIFILTTLLFAALSVVKIAAGRGSIKDHNPMLPSAFAAVTVYFLFLFNMGDLIVLNL